MATGLMNSAGTDFDSLFQQGTGTQLFYIYANNGQDVGQRYLPASAGSGAGNCRFYDPYSQDIGPKLCAIGTHWTYAVTVGSGEMPPMYSYVGYAPFVGAGALSQNSPPFDASYMFCTYKFSYYGETYYNNWVVNPSGTRYEGYMYRMDNGVTYKCGEAEVSSTNRMFTSSDIGKTIYFRVAG